MSKTQAMTRREQQPVGRTTNTIGDLLRAKMQDLAVVAPRGFDMESLIPKFLSRASRNPKLLACTPLSVYTTVHEAVQLGLDPMGPHGHYYVIPRRNGRAGGVMEANGQLGYKGMIELARRSGRVKKISAALVYEGEEFDYDRGTDEIHHPYKLGIDRSDDKIVAAYAVAVLDNGERVPLPLDRAQIEKRRARSLAKDDGPWVTDYGAMALKTAIRALFATGMVPMTKELAEQIEREDERDIAATAVDLPVATTVPASLPEPRQDPLPQPDPVPGWGDAEVPQNAPQDATEEMRSSATDDPAVRLDLENRILEACANLRLSVGGNKSWLASEMNRRWKVELLSEMDVPALETLCGELEARVG